MASKDPVVKVAEAAAASVDAIKTPLTSAPPQWHTLATVGAMISIFSYLLPSWDDIDQVAKVETFTGVVFPELLDVYTIACVRLVVALSIWSLSFWMVFIFEGWDQFTSYLPSSKLISIPNRLSGYKTMLPFTSLSWNLLGLSFSLNAYIGFRGAAGQPVNIWILRAAVILWDIAAPFTLLVAAVVRYAIWPAVLRKTGLTAALKSFRNVS